MKLYHKIAFCGWLILAASLFLDKETWIGFVKCIENPQVGLMTLLTAGALIVVGIFQHFLTRFAQENRMIHEKHIFLLSVQAFAMILVAVLSSITMILGGNHVPLTMWVLPIVGGTSEKQTVPFPFEALVSL